jgi:hypothetical protein
LIYAFDLRETKVSQTVAMLTQPEVAIFILQHELAVLTINLAKKVSDADGLAGAHPKKEIITVAHEVGDLILICTDPHDARFFHIQIIERHGLRTTGGLVGYDRNHKTVLLQRGNIGNRNSLPPVTSGNI